jgi:hypothetical protein
VGKGVGNLNSSRTRVRPIFDELLDRWPEGDSWLGELWDKAVLTRPGAALPKPSDLGTLLAAETPPIRAARPGTVYDRTVAPPAAFLRWLLENPQQMQVRDPINFGAKSKATRRWRSQLFSGDERLVGEAQEEGLNQFGKRLRQRGRNKWWAFEGFSHIDCCLITGQCVLFVEGTGTESVSPSTLWFQQRRQLWRNVEAAQEFAGDKQFGVILAVEDEAEGATALAEAAGSLDGSYPHLDGGHRAELSRHLIGFVTWPGVVASFGLRPEGLRDPAPDPSD